MKLRFGGIISVGEISKFPNIDIIFNFKEINVIIECSTFHGHIRCRYVEDLLNGRRQPTFYEKYQYDLCLHLEKAIINIEYEEEFIIWLQEIIYNNTVEILSALKDFHKNTIEDHEHELNYKKNCYNNFKAVCSKELILL